MSVATCLDAVDRGRVRVEQGVEYVPSYALLELRQRVVACRRRRRYNSRTAADQATTEGVTVQKSNCFSIYSSGHFVMGMKVNTAMRSRGALEERTRRAPVATPWQDARARSPPDPCVLLLMRVSLSRLPGSAALTPRPPERPAGWLTAGPLNGLEARVRSPLSGLSLWV